MVERELSFNKSILPIKLPFGWRVPQLKLLPIRLLVGSNEIKNNFEIGQIWL